MASILNADNGSVSGSAGLKSTADSSGVLALQTNGTTAVTVDTSQNVGIGTSSPTGKLDVVGDQVLRGNFGMTTAGYVYSYAGGANGSVRSGIQLDGTNQQTLFFTGTNERMRIDSSGNVGIGTASPANQLNVVTTSNGVARPVGVRNLSAGSSAFSIINVGNDTSALSLDIGVLSSTNVSYGGVGSTIIQANTGNMMFGTSTAYATQFITSGVERMRINAGAPILCLAGGSTTATGTGIAFPATQSASTDANTLDDYEEGTWTPVFNGFGGTGLTGTGQYTKIGRLVRLNAQISGSSLSSTLGTSYISGLPFTGAQANGGGASWSSSNTGVTFANVLIVTNAIYAPTQAATGSTLSFNATYYV